MRRVIALGVVASVLGCRDRVEPVPAVPTGEAAPARVREIAVRVAWPGANPEQVERALVWQLEEELSEVPDVRWVHSVARSGEAEVRIGVTDPDAALSAARERLVALASKLPAGTEEPVLQLLDAVVDWQVVVSGREWLTAAALRGAAERVAERLASLGGVREVSVCGGAVTELVVELDPARLAAREIAATEVADDLARRALAAAPDELGAQSVGAGSAPLQIKDIAVVERRASAAPCRATRDGRPVAVVELATTEATTTGGELEAALAGARGTAPAGVGIGPLSRAPVAGLVLDDTRPRWSRGVWPPERPDAPVPASDLAADVDRARAAELGVPVVAIATTLRLAIAGVPFRTADGTPALVRVAGDPGALQVRAVDGRLVTLSQVAKLSEQPRQAPILKVNRQPAR